MALDELTREFLIESQEGLDRMERCLTELEERPKDAELIGDIFRSVHTIKGTTGFLGFKRLEKLAHAGENLLGQLREGKLVADRPVITGLLKLLDGLRSILKSIEVESSEGGGEDAGLIALMEELQTPAKAPGKKAVRTKAGGRPAQKTSDLPQPAREAPIAQQHPAPELDETAPDPKRPANKSTHPSLKPPRHWRAMLPRRPCRPRFRERRRKAPCVWM